MTPVQLEAKVWIDDPMVDGFHDEREAVLYELTRRRFEKLNNSIEAFNISTARYSIILAFLTFAMFFYVLAYDELKTWSMRVINFIFF